MVRRGLSRIEAAAYVGIAPRHFDKLMKDGRMPSPRRADGRVVWDIREIDVAFERLPKKDMGSASVEFVAPVASLEAEPWRP